MLIHSLHLLMAEQSEADPGLVGYDEEEITACVFVPLLGDHGWKEE
jgi:hypothetical protein